jgi:hypothetical protein
MNRGPRSVYELEPLGGGPDRAMTVVSALMRRGMCGRATTKTICEPAAHVCGSVAAGPALR